MRSSTYPLSSTPPHPPAGGMAIAFVDVFSLLPCGYRPPLVPSFFHVRPCRARALVVMRSRIFNSCSRSWNRGFHAFSHTFAFTEPSPSRLVLRYGLGLSGCRCPDRTCWEAYLRREIIGAPRREAMVTFVYVFIVPIIMKLLLLSVNNRHTQVSNIEDLLNRQT